MTSDTPFEVPDTPLGPTDDFPSRPSHPDFARLCELVLELDAEAQANEGVEEILAALVDEASLGYMGLQRAARAMSLPGIPLIRATGLYLEAFIIGRRFERKYGKGNRGNQDETEATS